MITFSFSLVKDGSAEAVHALLNESARLFIVRMIVSYVHRIKNNDFTVVIFLSSIIVKTDIYIDSTTNSRGSQRS